MKRSCPLIIPRAEPQTEEDTPDAQPTPFSQTVFEIPNPPILDKLYSETHSDRIIHYIDLTKFNFDQIRHELKSNPHIHYIVCIDCGATFDRNLQHSLLIQHFQTEPNHSAIEIEHFRVIFIRSLEPLRYQPSLESFYLSLFPDMLYSWISNVFFKPFRVLSENITASRIETWEKIFIYPFKHLYQSFNVEPTNQWDLYHLLPFLFLLPESAFFGRNIRKENDCFSFTVSFKNSNMDILKLFSVKIDISNPMNTTVLLYHTGLSLFDIQTNVVRCPTQLDEKGNFTSKLRIKEIFMISFFLTPSNDLITFQSNGISPFVKESFAGTIFSKVIQLINKSQEKSQKSLLHLR
jgi:hypothetical protein